MADRVGVADAAKQLGLHESQIYSWRAQARLQQDRGQAEHQMTLENAGNVEAWREVILQ